MRIPLFSKPTPRATDPVCAMKVNIDNPPGGEYVREGHTYYFCGPDAIERFRKSRKRTCPARRE